MAAAVSRSVDAKWHTLVFVNYFGQQQLKKKNKISKKMFFVKILLKTSISKQQKNRVIQSLFTCWLSLMAVKIC